MLRGTSFPKRTETREKISVPPRHGAGVAGAAVCELLLFRLGRHAQSTPRRAGREAPATGRYLPSCHRPDDSLSPRCPRAPSRTCCTSEGLIAWKGSLRRDALARTRLGASAQRAGGSSATPRVMRSSTTQGAASGFPREVGCGRGASWMVWFRVFTLKSISTGKSLR